MNPARMHEIEHLCLLALEQPPRDLDAFLRSSTDDEGIRREVRELINARSRAGRVFDASPDWAATILSTAAPPEATTGQGSTYRIIEKLGEGGMGIVYRARQVSPVERDVALKMIRREMSSPSTLDRFHAERQALAKMEHPSIPHILDAGTTEDGQPFFVMELVGGQPIHLFCESHQLAFHARIELIIAICGALQHAHQKGLIHRDIKPSNVLIAEVDHKPVPKLIDFGIAKDLDDSHGLTRTGALVGSFDYASPEQMESGTQALDTRSDIYSLGALSYEILTGRPPLTDTRGGQAFQYSEFLRRIREEIPAPPSTHDKTLPRELDWILLKTLEKNPDRRYPTADRLSLDLKRLLAGDPVEAAPPSRSYRAWKIIGKHRLAIGAGAAMLLLAIVAIGWMAFALRQQNRVKAQALALREVVRKVLIERPQQMKELQNNTALRFQLMSDAEGALKALSAETNGDLELAADLAKGYAAIASAKGGTGTSGSVGDTKSAIADMDRSLALWDLIYAQQKPPSATVIRGRLDAEVTLAGLWDHFGDYYKAKDFCWRVVHQADQLSAAQRDEVVTRWYVSAAYKQIATLQYLLNENDYLGYNRKAIEVFEDGLPPRLMEDPKYRDQLASLKKEYATSGWTFAGYSLEFEKAAREAAGLMKGLDGPYRGSHANLEVFWGHMVAVGRDRAEGCDIGRRALSELLALQAADPGNKVLINWGGFARNHLAKVLATGGSVAEANEAIRLEEENLRVRRGIREDRQSYQWRAMHLEAMDQIVLAEAMWIVGRKAESKRLLEELLPKAHKNQLVEDEWAALRLLADYARPGSPERLEFRRNEVAHLFRTLVGTPNTYYSRLREQATVYAFAEDVLLGPSTGSDRRQARDLSRKYENDNRQLKVRGYLGALVVAPPPVGAWEIIQKRLEQLDRSSS